MHSISFLRLASLAGLASLVAVPAYAEPGAGYFYGGASIGQSRAKIDDASIDANLQSQGFATPSTTNDEQAPAWKAFAGYQFNRYVGIEGGYFSLGHFGFTSNTLPAGALDGRIRLRGMDLDLVGTLPLSGRFSAIARVGAQRARTSDSFNGRGDLRVLSPNPSLSETNVKFGAGLQYAFAPGLMLRGEAERYRVNDAMGDHINVNMYSVGLVFSFGTAAP